MPETPPTVHGPYWVRTTHDAHQVAGRHGTTLFSYPLDQAHLADAHVRRLQRRHKAHERAVAAAAPQLYDALELARDALCAGLIDEAQRLIDAALAGVRP